MIDDSKDKIVKKMRVNNTSFGNIIQVHFMDFILGISSCIIDLMLYEFCFQN